MKHTLIAFIAAATTLTLAAAPALAAPITIDNFSFEADENTASDGAFASGEALDFGGELTGWIRQGTTSTQGPSVGWKDIPAAELHPFPQVGDQESQALALAKVGAPSAVLNTTATAWSDLAVGDVLTLTISLGMRDVSGLNWNENTFFGLTDADADLSSVEITDTVVNSGVIANNPATGTQAGDGTFVDVSFGHTVEAADVLRNGNIGILISSTGTGANGSANQSFFDNVRLVVAPIPEPASLAMGLVGLVLILGGRTRSV